MRFSRLVPASLLTLLLPGLALANGGLVINGGAGNITISGMLSVTAPTSAGLEVKNRNSGQVNLNGATTLNTGAQHAVSLATNNAAHTTTFGGTLDIDTTSGTGFFASSGGTFVATGAGNSVTATSGPAISLTSTSIGGAGAAFGTVNSTNSGTRGIYLDTVSGSLTTTGGSITGAVGIPVEVNAGTVSMTYAGGITQAANNPMFKVGGGHGTGTVTFQTGTLNATNGTGLQFDNADGTYNFNGTTTLNGGDAGIDILNGSSGSFTFGTGATIANPSGVAFNMASSNASGTYSGSIGDDSGFAIDVDNHDSGTFTFQTGTLSSTGTGVRVANSNGGTIDFGFPTKTLNTAANTAVTLNTNNTGGTVNFTGGGLDIDTTTATAFSATGGGTVNVTGANNTIDTTSGKPLDIQNTNAGGSGITFARAISTGGGQVANIVTSTGTKTLGRVSTSSGATTALNLNGAGTVNIGDAALASSLTTTTAPAITINNSTLGFSGIGVGLNTTGGGTGVSVTGGTVAISGNGMVIDTDDVTDGPGFVATSGGTVTVQGTGHTVTSGNQTAVNIANTTIGVGGLVFKSVTSNGGSNTGIVLNTTGSNGGLTVTGDGSAGSGGTIANKTGADGSFTTGNGIYLNDTRNVFLAGMQLNDFQNSAIRGFSVNGFSLEDSVINGAIGNNTAPIEGAIAFGDVLAVGTIGLSGDSLIDNVEISGSIEHQIEVYNQTGTLDLTIGNSSIHDGGADGLQMEIRGDAQAFVHVDDNDVFNMGSQAVQISALENSNLHATVSNNTITRGTQGNEGILIANGGNTDARVLIGGPNESDGNTISGFGGVAIFVGQVPGQGTASSLLEATIQNNTVTTPATATNHAIIAFLSSETGQVSQARLLIDDNTVNYDSAAARAILVDAPDSGRTPEFHATVTNNTVTSTDPSALTMISVAARNTSIGHSDVRGNDVNYTFGSPPTGLNVREASGGSNVLARGASASNDSSVVLAANNTLSTTAILPTAGDVPVVENNTILLPAIPTLP